MLDFVAKTPKGFNQNGEMANSFVLGSYHNDTGALNQQNGNQALGVTEHEWRFDVENNFIDYFVLCLVGLYSLCFFTVYCNLRHQLRGYVYRLVKFNLVLSWVAAIWLVVLICLGNNVNIKFRNHLKIITISLSFEFMQIIFFLFAFKMK